MCPGLFIFGIRFAWHFLICEFAAALGPILTAGSTARFRAVGRGDGLGDFRFWGGGGGRRGILRSGGAGERVDIGDNIDNRATSDNGAKTWLGGENGSV